MSGARRIGLIGHGAIARALLRIIEAWHPGIEVVGIVRKTPGGITISELLQHKPDLVVECAGHEALRTRGPQVLAAGIDLLIASTGALADASLETALRDAAARGRSRALLIAGAVGGLDALAAARHSGLTDVCYIGRKPPGAWRGTAAEETVDLAQVSGPVQIFDGTAREAALRFPQNANVAAAIALAGLGFDRTRVHLTADPGISANLHRIEAQGAFGNFQIELAGIALPDNPRTSRLTVGSLARALEYPGGSIVFA